ncbi:GNAT family N-acetyltransferase [Cytobacillus sp. Hz8]|uniref:GNAT family N-acetyltransferase n=1 Tax=Cytobacillus sp. Hz8 TaxID=3347168 RepID=UPI0035D55407
MINMIEVSILKEDDKEVVRNLLVNSYQEYEPQYSNPEVWKSYIAEIKASVDNPNLDKILVAKNHHHILGTLQLFQSSEKAYGLPELEIFAPIVRLLAVHPAARGKGVAQQLLKASLLYAKELNAKSLYLHTSDKMKKAIQLYEWLGFKRDYEKEFTKKDIIVKCYRFDLSRLNGQ